MSLCTVQSLHPFVCTSHVLPVWDRLAGHIVYAKVLLDMCEILVDIVESYNHLFTLTWTKSYFSNVSMPTYIDIIFRSWNKTTVVWQQRWFCSLPWRWSLYGLWNIGKVNQARVSRVCVNNLYNLNVSFINDTCVSSSTVWCSYFLLNC